MKINDYITLGMLIGIFPQLMPFNQKVVTKACLAPESVKNSRLSYCQSKFHLQKQRLFLMYLLDTARYTISPDSFKNLFARLIIFCNGSFDISFSILCLSLTSQSRISSVVLSASSLLPLSSDSSFQFLPRSCGSVPSLAGSVRRVVSLASVSVSPSRL